MSEETKPRKKEPGKKLKAEIALIAILRLETIKNLIEKYSKKYKINNEMIRQWKKEVLCILFPQKVNELPVPYESEQPSSEKSNSEVIRKLDSTLKGIDTTLKTFNKTQKWANVILGAYVFATISMAIATVFMASFTKEIAELQKEAKLEIHFVMEAPFDLVPEQGGGIRFSVQDFIYNQEDINFYFEAINDCKIGIEDEITVIYKAKFCNIHNDEWGGKQLEEILGNIKLEPKEKQKLTSNLIWRLLLDEDKLNLGKGKENIDNFVKIEIEVFGKSDLKFPFGTIDIKYKSQKREKKIKRG